jgi:hypothetical protein
MIKFDFFENKKNKLFISFAPNDARGKYLFYAIRENDSSDCLYFNDLEEKYYVDDYCRMIEIIDEICSSHRYESVILTGFSAGALTSCLIGSRINFDGKITIHAFSPYISLNTSYTTAKSRLEHSDLCLYSLNSIKKDEKDIYINLYFSTTSFRDGIHVRDSFALSNPSIRSFYLNTGHDTNSVVRSNYPQSMLEIIRGDFVVSQNFIADSSEILKCLMMVDMGVAETENKISRFATAATKISECSAEYCHWQARQFARLNNVDDALHWGWAAIMKSAPNIPDSFPETVGHIAYDNGRPREAIQAYSQMKNLTPEITERIELLRGWNE